MQGKEVEYSRFFCINYLYRFAVYIVYGRGKGINWPMQGKPLFGLLNEMI